MKGAFGNEGALRFGCVLQNDTTNSEMIRRLTVALAVCLATAFILLALCWFGIWIPNEPSRATYPVRGVDVSHHQREIEWARVKGADIHFAYVKATEGIDFKDERFLTNWTEASAAGISRGAYHFFILTASGKLQAANFIATVPVEPNALPPGIDLEFSGYNNSHRLSAREFQRELSAFWDAIFAHYGKTPVIYTTLDFQKEYLAKMPLERLWIREVVARPRGHWMFWQYSPRGKVAGISTFVDLNVFNGSLIDFQKLAERKDN